MPVVKEILGHTDIKTTMRYAHLERRDVSSKARDVIDKLNKENGAYSTEGCHRFRGEVCHPDHVKPAIHSRGKLPPVGAKRRGVLHCYSDKAVVVNLA
jgi:hypothetical protein